MSERSLLVSLVLHLVVIAFSILLFIPLYTWYGLPQFSLEIFNIGYVFLIGPYAAAPYLLVSVFGITCIRIIWLFSAFRTFRK